MKSVHWCGRIVALWMLVISGSACASEGSVVALDAYLDQARQAGLLNGNILIANHGEVILRRAMGYADGSQSVPLALSDRFDIGSIAKEFDAVGIMMLAEEGRLSLDDTVSKFIPDLPSWSKTITVNDLLHYTSGLPDVDWNTVDNDADNFRNLRALKALDFPSGTHYAYNNNNTFLRRRVIEKVSGLSFEAFLKKRVFPKAGIRDAVVDPVEGSLRVAKGFDANFKQDPTRVYLTGWTALTVDDLLTWSNCVTTFCLISPRSTSQILATSNPKWQSGFGHGEMEGGRVVRHVHDGNDHNFQALLMADPPKGRTIILVTSQNRNDVYAVAEAINAILDGKAYLPLREAAVRRH